MQKLEVWMRGPIKDVPSLLQPVAHALLQAEEELLVLLENFPKEKLWERPAELASLAFHVQHICGVIDRMFTYAQQKSLSREQFLYLEKEGQKDDLINAQYLQKLLHKQIATAIDILQEIQEIQLTAPRELGREKIPTTLMGLLFHAAEHTQRHVGQALVTRKILLEGDKTPNK